MSGTGRAEEIVLMDTKHARTAFVEVEYTVYPLTPNSGHASERLVRVFYEPGYHADLVCTVDNAVGHGAIGIAISIAAALGRQPVDAIRVESRYFRREHRRAIVEQHQDEQGGYVKQSPRHAIERQEYDALLWGTCFPATDEESR